MVESELVSTEGDIAENGLEDMRELVETHSTQRLPLDTHQSTLTTHSIRTSISSWLSNASGDLSNNDVAGIIALCMNMTITVAQLCESLQ